MNPVLQALKELGQFLGAKLDTLAAASRAPIKIDIGDTSKKLGEAAKALELASKVLATTGKSHNLQEVNASIQSVASSLSSVVAKLKDVHGADFSETNKLLRQVIKSVQEIKLETKDVDLSGFEVLSSLLEDIRVILAEPETHIDRTDEIVAAIKELRIEIPKEFKLEAGQVAQIVHSGGGLGGATGSNLQPSKATVANVALTTANTQYSYTFPASTTGFRIKLRGQGTLMTYAWASGKMPTSGDGTAYSTVQQNHELVREQLDIGGKTIYLQTDENTHVAEIESYQI